MMQTHTRTLWNNVFFSFFFFFNLKVLWFYFEPLSSSIPMFFPQVHCLFQLHYPLANFYFLSLLPYSPSLHSLWTTYEKGPYTQKYIHSNSTALSSFYAWVEIFTLGTKPVVDEILNTSLWANTLTSTCTQKNPQFHLRIFLIQL